MVKKTKTIPNTNSGEKIEQKSEGPLSKYRYEAELVYEKKKSNFPNVKVGLEEIKKDMLKMMDKIDRLEDAFKFLKDRVTRLDGRG